MRASRPKHKSRPTLLKLDLGAGQAPREGYESVDLYADAKYKVDLFKFPWPFRTGSVEEIYSSNFFEHVPAKLRPAFMDELYRVLIPSGKATIIVPDGGSNRAVQDYTHEWPPVVPESFLYFNRGWREQNKLTHGAYAMKCDFDFAYSYSIHPNFQGRSQEFLQSGTFTQRNIATDLLVTLTRREG